MRRMSLTWVSTSLLALPLCTPVDSSAQTWRSAARAVSLTEENDAFRDSDSSYTQGLRIMTTRGWYPNPLSQRRLFAISSSLLSASAWLSPLSFLATERSAFRNVRNGCLGFNDFRCATTFVGVVQTQYTPNDLGADSRNVNNRPYAGLLSVSIGHTLLIPRDAFRTQLDLGVSGRPALSRETQSLAHWTWSPGAERPRGWHHQLRTSPHFQLTTLFSRALLSTCGGGVYFCDGWALDQSVRTETSLGTVMGRLSQGAVVRVGKNMPRLEGSDRIAVSSGQSAAGSGRRYWFLLFGTADVRGVGWNTLIEGTPWRDNGRDGWRSAQQVAARDGLTEWSLGGAAGGRWGGASFQWVNRSSEYRPFGGRHDYASLTVFLLRSQRASSTNRVKTQ